MLNINFDCIYLYKEKKLNKFNKFKCNSKTFYFIIFQTHSKKTYNHPVRVFPEIIDFPLSLVMLMDGEGGGCCCDEPGTLR